MPHRAGEGVIFAVAERRGLAALAMGSQPEPDRIINHLDPEMAARIASPPLQQKDRIILFKPTAPLQVRLVDLLQHLGKAALAQHSFRILPGVHSPG